MTPNRTPRLAVRFTSILLSFLVFFLPAEIGIRLFTPNLMALRELVIVGAHTKLPYTLKPNASIPFQGMHTHISPPVTWHTNAQGLRENVTVDPHTHKFRIATYGDSETFGWAVGGGADRSKANGIH